MFEHLDDDGAGRFRPGDRFRLAVTARGRALRLRRRLVTGLASVVVAVGAVGGAGLLYAERRDAAIDRTDITTRPSLDHATNVLVVGTDLRPAGSAGADDVTGVRADAIAVVRLRPDGTVGVLSLPRDLVDQATNRRLSAARADGRQALVDTVDRLTGLPVDHYIEMDMEGFADLVDDLGGLRLAVDTPLRDRTTGLDLRPSACATLDGDTALALVRARHLEGERGGDLDRIARTQAVTGAAVAALADVGGDPGAIDRISRALADHAAVDEGLTFRRLVSLGRALAAAGPSGVDIATVPVRAPADGATLELAPEAAPVLESYGADPPPASPTAATDPTVPAPAPGGLHPC